MKKYFLLLFLFLSCASFAGDLPADKARGVFISFGVGPRLPLADFGNNSTLGYGLNAEISYTDNDYLPVFLFLRAGYEQFAGSQDFYKVTEYSNFSTSAVPLNLGVRYYFAPLLENVVLFMPVVEISASCCFFQKLNEFKPTSGKVNYTENNTKLGVSAGVGVSMFLMEILATYNYYQTNQYVGIDLRVRLPLFISY
jgi:opacity protein-like surface antigen